MNNFSFILSILLEALPFILLGELLSGLIEVFVTDSFPSRMTVLRPVTAALVGSLMGVCLPMCECGSVLIVRRLIKKGVPPSAAIAYMLSAPICVAYLYYCNSLRRLSVFRTTRRSWSMQSGRS